MWKQLLHKPYTFLSIFQTAIELQLPYYKGLVNNDRNADASRMLERLKIEDAESESYITLTGSDLTSDYEEHFRNSWTAQELSNAESGFSQFQPDVTLRIEQSSPAKIATIGAKFVEQFCEDIKKLYAIESVQNVINESEKDFSKIISVLHQNYTHYLQYYLYAWYKKNNPDRDEEDLKYFGTTITPYLQHLGDYYVSNNSMRFEENLQHYKTNMLRIVGISAAPTINDDPEQDKIKKNLNTLAFTWKRGKDRDRGLLATFLGSDINLSQTTLLTQSYAAEENSPHIAALTAAATSSQASSEADDIESLEKSDINTYSHNVTPRSITPEEAQQNDAQIIEKFLRDNISYLRKVNLNEFPENIANVILRFLWDKVYGANEAMSEETKTRIRTAITFPHEVITKLQKEDDELNNEFKLKLQLLCYPDEREGKADTAILNTMAIVWAIPEALRKLDAEKQVEFKNLYAYNKVTYAQLVYDWLANNPDIIKSVNEYYTTLKKPLEGENEISAYQRILKESRASGRARVQRIFVPMMTEQVLKSGIPDRDGIISRIMNKQTSLDEFSVSASLIEILTQNLRSNLENAEGTVNAINEVVQLAFDEIVTSFIRIFPDEGVFNFIEGKQQKIDILRKLFVMQLAKLFEIYQNQVLTGSVIPAIVLKILSQLNEAIGATGKLEASESIYEAIKKLRDSISSSANNDWLNDALERSIDQAVRDHAQCITCLKDLLLFYKKNDTAEIAKNKLIEIVIELGKTDANNITQGRIGFNNEYAAIIHKANPELFYKVIIGCMTTYGHNSDQSVNNARKNILDVVLGNKDFLTGLCEKLLEAGEENTYELINAIASLLHDKAPVDDKKLSETERGVIEIVKNNIEIIKNQSDRQNMLAILNSNYSLHTKLKLIGGIARSYANRTCRFYRPENFELYNNLSVFSYIDGIPEDEKEVNLQKKLASFGEAEKNFKNQFALWLYFSSQTGRLLEPVIKIKPTSEDIIRQCQRMIAEQFELPSLETPTFIEASSKASAPAGVVPTAAEDRDQARPSKEQQCSPIIEQSFTKILSNFADKVSNEAGKIPAPISSDDNASAEASDKTDTPSLTSYQRGKIIRSPSSSVEQENLTTLLDSFAISRNETTLSQIKNLMGNVTYIIGTQRHITTAPEGLKIVLEKFRVYSYSQFFRSSSIPIGMRSVIQMIDNHKNIAEVLLKLKEVADQKVKEKGTVVASVLRQSETQAAYQAINNFFLNPPQGGNLMQALCQHIENARIDEINRKKVDFDQGQKKAQAIDHNLILKL